MVVTLVDKFQGTARMNSAGPLNHMSILLISYQANISLRLLKVIIIIIIIIFKKIIWTQE